MAKKVLSKKTGKKKGVSGKKASKKARRKREKKVVKETKSRIAAMIGKLVEDGLSQTDIARLLDVSPSTISQLKALNYDQSQKILEKHKESIAALLEEQGIDVSTIDKPVARKEETFGDWLDQQIQTSGLSPAELAKNADVSPLTINYILNGTTTNPQRGTRDKIEKALKSALKEKNKPFKPWKKIDEDVVKVISSGLPFSKNEVGQVPFGIGVYAIHDRRGFPTYIGKGNVRNRLKTHLDHRAFIEQRVAYTFSYVLISSLKDTDKDKVDALNKEALWLEKLLVRFVGNAVLVNDRLTIDLSDSEDLEQGKWSDGEAEDEDSE